MLPSTTTDDTPKKPALAYCNDPLMSEQTYMSYYLVEQKRYLEGRRHHPLSFKAAITTER